jgi:transcriptional regulator with XRE-family HTH domain
MKIGDKVKLLRELKNISTKEMADYLDMSLGGYLKIERNAVDVNTEKVEKISDLLGVKPAELYSLDEKTIFNFSNNEIKNGGYNVFHFPEEMKKLYEDKIKLLEDKITLLQDQLTFYKSKLN